MNTLIGPLAELPFSRDRSFVALRIGYAHHLLGCHESSPHYSMLFWSVTGYVFCERGAIVSSWDAQVAQTR
jgi:hypothetical protein